MTVPHWFELSMASGLIVAVFAAVISAPMYRWCAPSLGRLPCQTRARVITSWLVLPSLAAALLPLFSLVPNWMEHRPLGVDHCGSHHNGIAHLCWFEPLADTVLMSAGIAFFVAALALGLFKIAVTLIRYRRLQQRLQALGTPSPHQGCYYLETDCPVAFCAGLLRPRIYVSRSLPRDLGKTKLAVVLAHERCHCRRRDILRRVLIGALSLFHWPSVRRAMLGDLELAHEQICDEAAAQCVGDRLSVAETIVTMERRKTEFLQEMTWAMAFNGSHTEARVRALLDAPRPNASLPLVATALASAAILAGLLTLAMPLHHLPNLF